MIKLKNILEMVSDTLYTFTISPLKTMCHHIKWFFQRRIRKFDDRELWNIDATFYKWLLPRLKRFSKKTISYPTNYKSMSSWQKDLVNRVSQLESIVKYSEEEYRFPNPERYLADKEIKEYKKNMDDGQIRCIAYGKCVKNFNRWFYNSVNDLWY